MLAQGVKVAVAGGLAWELGRLLGAPRPVFAVLAVLVTMQDDAYGSLGRAAERLAGVVAGGALGLLAAHRPVLGAGGVAALCLASALLGRLLAVGGRWNSQVGVSALLVLASGAGLRYGWTRTWETVVGGAVAVLVTAVLWPPDPAARLRDLVDRARLDLAADLGSVAAALTGPPARLAQARRAVLRHAARVEGEVADLGAAEEGERLWRRAGSARLASLEARLGTAAVLYRHLRSLVRHALEGGAPAPAALAQALAAVGGAVQALAADGHPAAAAAWVRQARAAVGAAPAARGPAWAEAGHLVADLGAFLEDLSGEEGRAATARSPNRPLVRAEAFREGRPHGGDAAGHDLARVPGPGRRARGLPRFDPAGDLRGQARGRGAPGGGPAGDARVHGPHERPGRDGPEAG